MENKYFTPKLEDIHVGYVCEILPVGKPHTWEKGTLRYETGHEGAGIMNLNPFWWTWKLIDGAYPVKIQLHNLENIRVSYLTTEQIEAEGWTKNDYPVWRNRMGFQKDNFFLVLDLSGDTPWINMIVKDPSLLTIVNPETFRVTLPCPSINEFKTICKLLNIN